MPPPASITPRCFVSLWRVSVQHLNNNRVNGLYPGRQIDDRLCRIACDGLPVLQTRPLPGIIRFGAYEVDTRSGELRKHGIRLRLQDQPFRVLQILLEHSGEVVTRDELQRQIWPSDTFVDFDRGLNNAVKRLREALNDSADEPRYVETLAKRGYRFIAAVETRNEHVQIRAVANHTVDSQQAERQATSHIRAGLIAALAVLAFASALFGLDIGGWRSRLFLKLHPPVIQSLAVLPLQNLSGDPAQEYLADGITDALITALAQIPTIKVVSRTSVMRYKKTDEPLPEIARELNVDGIIEGTVQRSNDKVRITTQLIYGPLDKHIWANSYVREVRSVFALEDYAAQDIAQQIRARLSSSPSQLSNSKPADLKARDAYLQGNYHLGRGPGKKEVLLARRFLKEAIEADSNFAPAYMLLAHSYFTQLQSAPEDKANGLEAAEKAVALAPSSPQAHVTLGAVKVASWDWSGAEEELRRAIALNFSYADAHETLCDYLEIMGRLEEDLSECQIAQDLDPDFDHLSGTFEVRRQYDSSIVLLRRMNESNPNYAPWHYDLFRDYLLNGQPKEAFQELEQSLNLMGFPEDSARVHRAFAASGYRGALRELARVFERLHAMRQMFWPRIVAEVYTQLGDKERAFYWLEEGYDHREISGAYGDLVWLKQDHGLDPLRSDPRFVDLLRRMKLPPD